MVPVNDNNGNIINLDDYREPVDTRATEFFDALADEFMGVDSVLITVIAMYRDENGKLSIKDYKLC